MRLATHAGASEPPGVLANLIILALAIWVLALQFRIRALGRKIETLEVRVRALAAEREPLVLDTVMIGPAPAVETAGAGMQMPGTLAAALRTWAPWISVVALAGLVAGYLYELSAGRLGWAAAILFAASALALLIGRHKNLAGATVALCVTGAMQIWTWPLAAQAAAPSATLPFLSSLLQIGLVSYAARRHWSQASAFAAHAAGVLLGVAGYFNTAHASLGDFAAALALALALALGSALSKPHRRERNLTAFAGAWGAAALCAIAAFSQWQSGYGIAALAIGAAALACFAILEMRRTPSRRPWPAAFWMGASAALALLLAQGLASGPAGGAVAALMALAFVGLGRPYPALRAAACLSALVALIHVAAIPALGWAASASAIIAAAALSMSARLARNYAATGDTLDAASWGAVLVIAFAAIDANVSDVFTRAALDSIALIGVGLLASPHSVNRTPARQWLGPALVAAGFVVALGGCGVSYNPWWGEAPAPIRGVPILNAMTLAFAAPAALAFMAAARWRTQAPRFARFCLTVSCIFALMWIVLELRRAFHGAQIATATTGVFELVAYAGVLAAAFAALRTGVVRQRLLDFASRVAAQ